MKKVELYCDGACRGNPGPGGWGVILRFGKHEKKMCGSEANTTNNRMELMACIAGLKSLKEPCEVHIFTDSQYLANAFQKGWLDKWQKNGWRTAGRTSVKNKDLWEELVALSQIHRLVWNWIKGHSGHPENELCDKMASEAINKIKI